MSGVHTNHIHARKKQLTDKVLIAAAVADGCNNLGLFHIFFTLISKISAKLQRIFEKQSIMS